MLNYQDDIYIFLLSASFIENTEPPFWILKLILSIIVVRLPLIPILQSPKKS